MKLFWLDLETTGLDPEEDAILEVAVSEAEFLDPFNAKEIYHAVIFHPSHTPWGQWPSDKHYARRSEPGPKNWKPHADLSEFIRDMHGRNGLLQECDDSLTGFQQVEVKLLELIPWIEEPAERPILAGSTINFDQSFIRAHWPELAKRFSHRLYDVSALKLFCRSMGMEKVPKAEAHRAKDDVLESIAHGRLCQDWLALNLMPSGGRWILDPDATTESVVDP
jgi:oligoribonuclease